MPSSPWCDSGVKLFLKINRLQLNATKRKEKTDKACVEAKLLQQRYTNIDSFGATMSISIESILASFSFSTLLKLPCQTHARYNKHTSCTLLIVGRATLYNKSILINMNE